RERRVPSAQNSTDFVPLGTVAVQCTTPLSTEPSAMLEDMLGAVTTTGTVTTAVGAETALRPPSDGSTETRSGEPASAAATGEDWAVAPAIVAQVAPARSQRCHEYENVPGLPVHEPAEATSVCPATGDPLIDGAVVFVDTFATVTWPSVFE